MTEPVTIYMPLLDEGVDVWRPVLADPLDARRYRILGPVLEEEIWAFAPGTTVLGAMRALSEGSVLVAEALAE